ncbi:MAG: MFS transporter [Rhodospirillales bacterium]
MTSAADTIAPGPVPSGRDDLRVIGVIGAAHFTSHFFQMSIPALFFVLKDAFDVGYTELGLLMTVFYGVSGLGQPIAGFVVDRIGARAVLTGGLVLLGAAMLAIAMAPTYWVVLALMPLAGVGNCVFHPADYSILSASVSPRRMGRAFSVHALGGTMGYVVAPLSMVGLDAVLGWRLALTAIACFGLAAALAVHLHRDTLREDRAGAGGTHGGPERPLESGAVATLRLLLSPPMLLCFAYFAFLASAGTALQGFLAPSMFELHAIPIAAGLSALTAYLLGQACGILAGGYTADRFRRHDLLVAIGLTGSASLVLSAGLWAESAFALTALLAMAGFMAGSAQASRDMLVRSATPKGASGKVFGFVYSGLDLGSTASPFLAGYLLDRGMPLAVIFLIAAGQALAMTTALGLGRRRRALQPAPAE